MAGVGRCQEPGLEVSAAQSLEMISQVHTANTQTSILVLPLECWMALASYLTFMSLSFLLCKIRMIMVVAYCTAREDSVRSLM